jgi:hypothetical protein
MSEDKSTVEFTISYVDKFALAIQLLDDVNNVSNIFDEQREVLSTTNVILSYQLNYIDNNGMSKDQSKRFWELEEQLRPLLNASARPNIDMAKVDQAGLTGQVLEMQRIVNDTKGSRRIIQVYKEKINQRHQLSRVEAAYIELFPGKENREFRERLLGELRERLFVAPAAAPLPPETMVEIEEIIAERDLNEKEAQNTFYACFTEKRQLDRKSSGE